jgi:hypothetical protein
MPAPTEFGPVLSALDAYRKTSPEMVVFSRLIRDALPARTNDSGVSNTGR